MRPTGVEQNPSSLAEEMRAPAPPDDGPDNPVGTPTRWGVLRHRHFRNVWMATFVSNIGNWMELLAIQLVAAHLTGSLQILGSLAAAQMFPILVFGLLGGLLADRVNRKRLLVATQCLLMLLAGTLALASASDQISVPLLFGVSIAHGVVTAFNMPAWQVITPRLVPKEELTRAITLNGVQFNMARCIGPAVAGFVMGLYGATSLFMINTLTFIAVLIAVLRIPEVAAPQHDGHDAWTRIGHALAFMFKGRGPLCVFLAMLLMSTFAPPLIRVIALYTIDVYQLTAGEADQAAGLLLSLLGIGAVIGGILLRWLPAWYPKHHFIPFSLAGAGLTITLFSLTGSLVAGIPAMLLVGIFWLWGFNQAWAAMQHLAPDTMRGRVMALFIVASFGVAAAGNMAAGWLGESLKAYVEPALATQLSIGILAVLLMIGGIVMMIWRVPEVDGIRPGDPDYVPRRTLYDAFAVGIHRPGQILRSKEN